jgi:predicted nucleic acid-binding protein
MTVVVSDTSPINYLVLIGHIDVLPTLFGNVLIPAAVHQELQQPGTPSEVRAWLASSPAWLVLKHAHITDPSLDLDAGETEAIALAEEVGANLLLMDERKGSREARRRGLNTAGTLAILDRADLAGLLDFEGAIAKLGATNFHLPPLILKSMVNTVRGRKQKT